MADAKWGATLTCPRHPNADLIEDYHAGDMICPECGLVVGDRYGFLFTPQNFQPC